MNILKRWIKWKDKNSDIMNLNDEYIKIWTYWKDEYIRMKNIMRRWIYMSKYKCNIKINSLHSKDEW